MSVPLGSKLKYFRERARVSQLTLETATNSATGMISRIEKLRTNPTKETVYKIADYLNLNSAEIDYLLGKTAEPASDTEMQKARDGVAEYFDKKFTLAYMTDERSRLIDISKGFCLLADISEEKRKKLQGQLFPLMLLRDEFGLKQFIDKEKMEKVLLDAFDRTFTEMGFMKEDEFYETIVKEIQKYPIIKELWKKYEQNPRELKVRTMDNRTVYFQYHGIKIQMRYHAEVLPTNPRFMILDYKPANFLLKVLMKFN